MRPDDLRHGTYAGFQAHKADRQTPCGECKDAAYRYTKAMKIRLAKSGSNLVTLGKKAHGITVNFPIRLLSELTGISDPKLYTYRTAGPGVKVHVNTRLAILGVNRADLWTPIGIQRRVRALTALGHAAPAIAEAAGMSRAGILSIRADDDLAFVRTTTAVLVRRVYESMSMTLPPSTTSRDRANATRMRAMAEKNGWLPPLAWDDIDLDERGKIRNVAEKYAEPIVDEALVLRAIETHEGDIYKKATPAERAEIARRWFASGRSLNALAELTGWRVDRYFKAAA